MIMGIKPHSFKIRNEVLKYIDIICKSLTPGLWMAMFLVGFLSVYDIFAFYIEHNESLLMKVGLTCFACLLATVYTLLLNLTRGRKCLYFPAVAYVSLSVILSLVNGLSYIFYGIGISSKMITLITETNLSEVKEFIQVMPEWIAGKLYSPKTIIAMASAGALYVIARKLPRKVFSGMTIILSMVGLGYVTMYFINSQWGRTNHIVTARAVIKIKSYIESVNSIQQLLSQHRGLPNPETVEGGHYARNLIFVIGESASRDHHSKYGYRLPTTPHLDSIGSGLYVFTDALASSSLTSENMPRILTFMSDEPSDKEWYEYASVIQLMKKMGYAVGWITNQERTGKFSNLSVILSEDADMVKYVGAINSEDHLMDKYDESILPPFRDFMAIQDSLKFVCLHLMGSHMDFRYRYPPERSVFSSEDVLKAYPKPWLNASKAQVVAEYDNSILYTDSILNEVIESIRHLPEPSALLYVSDHGHTVYDKRDYYGRDSLSAEVPFMVYLNDAYINMYPEIAERLEKSVDRPFSTSQTIYLILSLSGGKYVSYKESEDPISPAFAPRRRYFDGKLTDKTTNQFVSAPSDVSI